MLDQELGLLCHGEEGHFTVADLSPHSYQEGLNLASFRTDVVLPLLDRFLCWVDYYQGMLLLDFQPTDPLLELKFIARAAP
ncbi:unnamed protein product [Urochloa humidicola]